MPTTQVSQAAVSVSCPNLVRLPVAVGPLPLFGRSVERLVISTFGTERRVWIHPLILLQFYLQTKSLLVNLLRLPALRLGHPAV
jgi:hypothetical protein